MNNEIVFTGIGVVSSIGVGIEDHWEACTSSPAPRGHKDFNLKSFKPAKYLSDRKMMKAVTHEDAIGLVAIEGVKENSSYSQEEQKLEDVGLYVGGSAAFTSDNDSYKDSVNSSRVNGRADLKKFGKTCMESKPTALLFGLPNNVLCYGSLILQARGPNSNYTSNDTSAHLAILGGARQLRRGRLKVAFAGGYSGQTNSVNHSIFQSHSLVRNLGPETTLEPYAVGQDFTVMADGAAFVSMELRSSAQSRGAAVFATLMGGATGSDALGPLQVDPSAEALVKTMHRAVENSGISKDEIGLVLTTASGNSVCDSAELTALTRVFSGKIAVGFSTRSWGHLKEAGGVAEIGLVPYLYEKETIPEAMSSNELSASGFTTKIDNEKPYCMILRVSPWGEYSCIIVRKEKTK